ncbi:MAG: hypothetical protein ACK56I_36060, partial [bacterium]
FPLMQTVSVIFYFLFYYSAVAVQLSAVYFCVQLLAKCSCWQCLLTFYNVCTCMLGLVNAASSLGSVLSDQMLLF